MHRDRQWNKQIETLISEWSTIKKIKVNLKRATVVGNQSDSTAWQRAARLHEEVTETATWTGRKRHPWGSLREGSSGRVRRPWPAVPTKSKSKASTVWLKGAGRPRVGSCKEAGLFYDKAKWEATGRRWPESRLSENKIRSWGTSSAARAALQAGHDVVMVQDMHGEWWRVEPPERARVLFQTCGSDRFRPEYLKPKERSIISDVDAKIIKSPVVPRIPHI